MKKGMYGRAATPNVGRAVSEFQESQKKKFIPENFADQILSLELDLERESIEISTINRLVELYAMGVEYYDAMRDEGKYIAFKHKLQNLWSKPQVVQTLNLGKTVKAKPTIQDKKKSFKQNLTQIVSEKKSEKKATDFISEHEKYLKSNIDIVQNDMESQKQKVLSRIAERKNTAKSVPKFHFRDKPKISNAVFEGDKSAGENITEKELIGKRIIRERLTEIIEQNQREREKALEDAKKKYKSQLSTLESQLKSSKSLNELKKGNGILQKVFDKLKLEELNSLKKIDDEFTNRLETEKRKLLQSET